MTTHEHDLKAGRRRVARSRGALSGVLLIILGAWAALIPLLGPVANFGFQPNADDTFHFTNGRWLYEILPGAVAALAGILVLVSASRALTVTVAWIAGAAGAWLVVGPTLDTLIDGVSVGAPDATPGTTKYVLLILLYFYAIGGAILFLAGTAAGRLSVHSIRDVRSAERRADSDAERERADRDRQTAGATAVPAAAEDRHEQHAERRHERHERHAERDERRNAVADDTGRHVDDSRSVDDTGRPLDERSAVQHDPAYPPAQPASEPPPPEGYRR